MYILCILKEFNIIKQELGQGWGWGEGLSSGTAAGSGDCIFVVQT